VVESAAEDSAWVEWFRVQYELCQRVEDVLREGLAERPRVVRAALLLALIEELVERLRRELELTPGGRSG
jgi:hypothetical protein